jgi:curved DNA-binding protein CbpA
MGQWRGPPDPYLVLGVARTATGDEIRAAFRRLAALHHPDRNPDDAGAVDRFKAVNAAHQVIGDPARRRAYDVATAPRPDVRSAAPTPPAPPVEHPHADSDDACEVSPLEPSTRRRRSFFWSPFIALALGAALALCSSARSLSSVCAANDAAGTDTTSAVDLTPFLLAVVIGSALYVVASFVAATRRGERWRRGVAGGSTAHGDRRSTFDR